MANSKHAHLRYNIMDYCFRNKSFTFEELHSYINEKIAEYYPGEGVQKRSVRTDLSVFRNPQIGIGFNAPLQNKIRILQYSNPNFSIADRPLLIDEKYLIDAAQQLLERFENHPKYDKLAEALIKFQDEEDSTDDSNVLYYDSNEEYNGIKLLKPFYLAIKKKEVLEITYKGFNSEKSYTYEFHPQILKQYNSRWFVFGTNKKTDINTWSIPLDERIINYKPLQEVDYKLSTVNWEAYFRNIIGVRREPAAELVRVVLKFHNGRKKYFTSKPFIPDYDEFFEDEKQDQVWFDTIINQELMQQILSYGKDVEVFEPIALKKEIKIHVKEMYSFYKN